MTTVQITVNDEPVDVPTGDEPPSPFTLDDAFESVGSTAFGGNCRMPSAQEAEGYVNDPTCYVTGNELVLEGDVVVVGGFPPTLNIGTLRDDLAAVTGVGWQHRYIHWDGRKFTSNVNDRGVQLYLWNGWSDETDHPGADAIVHLSARFPLASAFA